MSYSNKTGLPSVTEIINAACANWIPTDFFTEEGRDRGTAVHEWCAAYVTDQYCLPLKNDWRGYCQSFKLWADAYLEEVLLCEKRLIHPMGYCGKPDLVCKIKGRNGAGLIDLKTGAKSKAHRIQIAAYRHLTVIPSRWAGVLRLKDDGSMPIMDEMPVDCSGDFNVFCSAYNLFNFFK